MRLVPPMRLSLDARRSAERHQPSVDVLLESLAASLGRQSVGVVLSGMGSDGARGVTALVSAGARAIAQDESSCAVTGMPKAAVASGARSLSVEDMSSVLRSLAVNGGAR
jgi:two-component system chemotaxis response regulator CheB